MQNIATIKLFPPQREVLRRGLLECERNCLLGMATGSGKTFLSEIAIEKTLSSGYRALYVTPLRAIAEQQTHRWEKRFGNWKVGIFTGETIRRSAFRPSYATTRLYVMTPERLDACLRNWRTHWSWIPDVSLVIVDEFHLLGIDQRGARLEGALTRLFRLNPFVRVLGLSATLPNIAELADWLGGDFYASNWRQIPLEKKIVRFTSAKEKPLLLLDEVRRCVDAGGQSLVFCNSRSRVQALAAFLNGNGIDAECHHAGLARERRGDVEARYKARKIRVLVATSTLEMGLNLPARQVVVYDSYTFDETGFRPLPVWSFIQRAGRAGRPGLDASGEVVLFLSRWASGAERYLDGRCEPVSSHLDNPRLLAEQILVDVFTGLSRTSEELENGFLPLTLFKRQHIAAIVQPTINRLVEAELLRHKSVSAEDFANPAEDGGGSLENLYEVTPLGRLSVKLMLAPETIRLVRSICSAFGQLLLFDMLIIASLVPDASPVLPVNYEELDDLCGLLVDCPSRLLDQSLSSLRHNVPETPPTPRLLAAIKMAALCMEVTNGAELASLAERFGVYEADIRMLRESSVRLLQGLSAIATELDREMKDDEYAKANRTTPGSAPFLCSLLKNMLEYGISPELVALTTFNGVGGKTARKLASGGYATFSAIAAATPGVLSEGCGIGVKLAASIVEEARKRIASGEDAGSFYVESFQHAAPPVSQKATPRLDLSQDGIDPYRLRRSLELRVSGHDGARWNVTGGREDHVVLYVNGVPRCDCQDFAKNGGACKHILCVRRARRDSAVLRLDRALREERTASIRDSLSTLWFATTPEDCR